MVESGCIFTFKEILNNACWPLSAPFHWCPLDNDFSSNIFPNPEYIHFISFAMQQERHLPFFSPAVCFLTKKRGYSPPSQTSRSVHSDGGYHGDGPSTNISQFDPRSLTLVKLCESCGYLDKKRSHVAKVRLRY